MVIRDRIRFPVVLAAALAFTGAGCGDDDNGFKQERTQEQVTTTSAPAAAPAIKVTATDYGFDVPATVSGGIVDMTLDNAGKEPHFAAFAHPAEGKSIEDVRAALTALAAGKPPAGGPPPFVEYIALGTVDPGGQTRLTGNLPAGRYMIFCMLPSPDGVTHGAKGMIKEVEATGGTPGDLPRTDATIPTFDFAFGNIPAFKAGTNSVTQHNKGKQIHEIDLVELAEGKKVEDMVAWAAKLQGPPPGRFLGGPAVRDGAPHITKGMYSPEFQVRS